MSRELRRLAKTGKVIEVNGKEYKLSPLELRHLAELEEWAEREPFRRLKEKIELARDAGASENAIDHMTERAYEDSKSPYFRGSLIESIAGIRKSIGMALSINHPKLSDKDVHTIIDSVGMDTLKDMVDDLSDLSEEESKNSDSEAVESKALSPK